MEIIAEIVSALLGGLVEILFEIAAQAAVELLAEIGLRSLAEPFKPRSEIDPVLSAIGYCLYGALAGGISLLLPRIFTAPGWVRIVNLVLTPLACGYLMAYIGKVRERRGDRPLRMDTFLYGYLFALAMAIVRLIWR
jgi:hypothetical protein